MNWHKHYRVEPGRKVRLQKIDPDSTGDLKSKPEAEHILAGHTAQLDHLQTLLYAGARHSLLVVLQGMDASGKDGAIKHVMSGINPQGCSVTSFKEPSRNELEHDFLWRVHQAVPPRGRIAIFNRSHYEDVLIARVHNLAPKKVWSARYGQINAFEKILTENNVRILKFFLHVSKAEQQRRLRARLDDPHKYWKFSKTDLAERRYWDDYQTAYEAALSKCSTPHAPWFIIPSNQKWFRNVCISSIIIEELQALHMRFPAPK
ncbi:MAG TPA: polyphosphate kinase [Solibacterales bacterium]|nr:polyphosphate kinase [Bryobacterales bacterium]